MYHKFDEQKITDFSDVNVSSMYSKGYKFTRINSGVMQSTKSLRIDLRKFELTSENRRILRKNENLTIHLSSLPYEKYSWRIAKMCKDFYDVKFQSKIFSINKAKLLFSGQLNMNGVLEYTLSGKVVGYCLVYFNDEMLHYCYPFYDLDFVNKSLGIGMMTMAIIYAKSKGSRYVYLGGLNSDRDKYKLQFKGVEVWNNLTQSWEVI